MAVLTIKAGWSVGTKFKLLKEPNRIGRGRACQIRLDVHGISRTHAQVEPGDGGWVLTDLGSTNGTYVQGSANYGYNAYGAGFTIESGSSLEISFDISSANR